MKQSKKWMLVALALLAMVALPLVGCKNAAGGETPPKIPSNVDSLIEKLSRAGPYNLVATGNWSSGDLSTLAEALKKDGSKKVNLDLSGVEGLTTIGSYAFSYCRSLVSITIPASVTSIGEWAFYGCSSLVSITIPASVTSIGSYAFTSCSSLTSITIPASVTSIGEWAFFECSKLTTVTMEATTPPKLGGYGFGNRSESNDFKILVPKDSETKYKEESDKTDSNWNPYKDKIIEQTS